MDLETTTELEPYLNSDMSSDPFSANGNSDAPYGYDDEGVPLAPYGYKKDGTPAKQRGRKAGSTSSGEKTPSRRSSSLKQLEEEIADAIGGDLAASIGVMAPLVAFVLEDRADRTARALASIASRSPRFKASLEKAFLYKDFVTLVSLPPAIAVAIAVEVSVIKPDSQMSRRFNLYEPWLKLYGENGSETAPEYRVLQPMGLLGQQ